jgi:type VI secretion system secreted protein VgrG
MLSLAVIGALYGASPALAASILGSELASFAVLGASTVTNTGATIVTGHLGVGPGTAITGFSTALNTFVNVPPGTVSNGPGLVSGTIFAGGAVANQANLDAGAAFGNLNGQTCDFTYAAVAHLGSLASPAVASLPPGVHCFLTSAHVNGTLTLSGGATDVWVFKMVSTLVTASNAKVLMGGAALSSNVFWAVGSSATLGTGTAFSGTIIASQSVSLTTGANISGRAIALVAAVTMDTNNVGPTISLPAPDTRPDVSQVLLDHFQCYEAKSKSSVTTPRVDVVDQFGTRTNIKLGSPSLICAPAVKNHDGSNLDFPDDIRNLADHLVCYDLPAERARRGDDNDRNRENGNASAEVRVSVDNQFGPNKEFTVKQPKMLCVPSLKERL